uniref:Rap-GAP domain-containing protein n=1 Tax=Arcella intermedia TaxID=1963864 RepID=A0A6B2L7H9_9EUKA
MVSRLSKRIYRRESSKKISSLSTLPSYSSFNGSLAPAPEGLTRKSDESDSENELMTKVLLRNGTNDSEATLLLDSYKTLKPKQLSKLLKKLSPSYHVINLRPLPREKLLEYEANISIKYYKFGVLYCRQGQRFEEEMYRNNVASPAFSEFLDMLGDKIALKNHSGWNAGLDTQDDRDGTHSIYNIIKTREKEWTDYDGSIEVMFHVSTMLGFVPGEIQQINRKRHIGNDVVVIIYTECSKPFSPIFISSKFNQIFIVVKRLNKTSDKRGKSVYRVSVTSRDGVGRYHPELPHSKTFEHGTQFRDWLLLKCINGERTAYLSSAFKEKREESRRNLLSQLFQISSIL